MLSLFQSLERAIPVCPQMSTLIFYWTLSWVCVAFVWRSSSGQRSKTGFWCRKTGCVILLWAPQSLCRNQRAVLLFVNVAHTNLLVNEVKYSALSLVQLCNSKLTYLIPWFLVPRVFFPGPCLRDNPASWATKSSLGIHCLPKLSLHFFFTLWPPSSLIPSIIFCSFNLETLLLSQWFNWDPTYYRFMRTETSL